tara:strand:+ start:417 stop:980 length:564 start_codon:yes stop_codon:yes gene_type:complete
MTEEQQITEPTGRRGFIKNCLQVGVLTTLPSTAFAGRYDQPHYATHFKNSHTGETYKGVYRIGNKYLPDAFEQISYALRDFRTGEVHPIDPRLIDIITSLQIRAQTKLPFEIVSGYRSPKTNAMLRNTSTGVAKNSYHMKGRAVDLRIPSYSTSKLKNIALDMRAGGVGYYPKSNFIHLDTGDVRTW